MNTDYKIEALNILLDEDCLSPRYYPLIAYKENIIEELEKLGCTTKNDVLRITDEELINIGLSDYATVGLF